MRQKGQERIMNEQQVFLSVRHLVKRFPVKQSFLRVITKSPGSWVQAVDDVSFDIKAGETVGLVGESGCGKSTLAKTLTGLYKPDDGEIIFDTGKSSLLEDTHVKIQMVFQDPYSSLNPRMTIRQMFYEILSVHRLCPRAKREEAALHVLNMVGMDKAALDRYSSQFSGGQRQRISIARALIMNPKCLIADEPVSALDVSIQAQIINLMDELKNDLNIAMLFISHDLRVVHYISDRVAVMYLGKIVELAPAEMLFKTPAHPYTNVLMKAAPILDPDNRVREYVIEGDPPSPIELPSGCRFHPRCPKASENCKTTEPPFLDLGNGRMVACHSPLVYS
jgi:oligopeptide/dipeptide ABC transporter ATP-binding protein